MAALVVTPEAVECIRTLIEKEEIAQPIVSVGWDPGVADLKRRADGTAVWTHETPSWLAVVLDGAELTEAGVEPPVATAYMHGYPFILHGKTGAPLLENCTLTCEGGKLVVHEGDI